MVRKEVIAVYFAGLMQGLTLVAFPAASSIFTNPHDFNFSNTAYGGLFVPQAILSILASLLGAKFSGKGKIRTVFFIGLIANFLSMALLATSATLMGHSSLAYGTLLLATGILGIGFGLTVPTLNTFATLFFPKKTDSAVLILNAFLGLGTAMAPVLVTLFIHFSIWWGLPIFLGLIILGLCLFSLSLPLKELEQKKSPSKKTVIPIQFWLFASFALLYGMVETINGNWAVLYMSENEHASTPIASLALAIFWAMVTMGRIFFAAIQKVFPEKLAFRTLPFIAAVAFILIALLPSNTQVFGILTFGLAGLGCSALLPLTISFGNKALPSISAQVAGGVIAFYLLGYGIAAFGVGAVQDMLELNLKIVFGLCTVFALLLGALSFKLTKTIV